MSSLFFGLEVFVYSDSDYNQDQDLDKVDFPHLNARLRQYTVQELCLTFGWIICWLSNNAVTN